MELRWKCENDLTGEVKKVLCGETGLEVDEQKLVYRGRERENGEYLDVCGVKDRSKVVLIQDPSSIERRFIQMRINAKIQTAHRAINNVAVQLDQLADQVCMQLHFPLSSTWKVSNYS